MSLQTNNLRYAFRNLIENDLSCPSVRASVIIHIDEMRRHENYSESNCRSHTISVGHKG